MFVQRAPFLSVSLSGASCQISGQPLRQVHRRRVCPVVQVDHILPANAKRPRSPVFPAGGGAAFCRKFRRSAASGTTPRRREWSRKRLR